MAPIDLLDVGLWQISNLLKKKKSVSVKCSKTRYAYISFYFFLKLKYSWFIMFKVYSKVIKLYVYKYIERQIIYVFFRFLSITGYYKILKIVTCAIE